MNSLFNACLICGSLLLKKLVGYEKDHLVTCKSCGFVFSQWVPTLEELRHEYESTYTRSDDVSVITLSRFPELLNLFGQYKVNNTIIDVGAGNGHFIKAAKDAGWIAYGTEFEERAVRICEAKGIIMQAGKLDSRNYKPDFFDVITSFEVIEHINNPLEELTNFNRILRPGGLVYITTPNFNSLSRRIIGGKWSVFNYPEHLSYYTPRTLNQLFTSKGFKCVKMETTGINYDRFVKSLGFKSGLANTCSTESLREMTEGKGIGRIIKRVINSLLTITGSGDKIKAVYVKVKTV
jgi:2-polyprenyl-3-methyl-5-hydroxy-6-metoxy-1,4-benzoquinol methylase